MTDSLLRTQLDRSGWPATLVISGELDVASGPVLEHAVARVVDGQGEDFRLDLSELTFMDSSGLHAILTARARFAEADCRLVLLKGCHQVQQIFELMGVDGVLEFVSARDARGLAAAQSS